MHELLLFGQIPAARHEQLLNILAGLSAMQPQRVLERHVLFRPSTIPTATGPARGGSQGVAAQKQSQQAASRNANTDVFYVNLVKAVGEEEFGKSMDVEGGERVGIWKLRLQETPVPGKRATIMRFANETPITSGDAQAYVENLGYSYV